MTQPPVPAPAASGSTSRSSRPRPYHKESGRTTPCNPAPPSRSCTARGPPGSGSDDSTSGSNKSNSGSDYYSPPLCYCFSSDYYRLDREYYSATGYCSMAWLETAKNSLNSSPFIATWKMSPSLTSSTQCPSSTISYLISHVCTPTYGHDLLPTLSYADRPHAQPPQLLINKSTSRAVMKFRLDLPSIALCHRVPSIKQSTFTSECVPIHQPP